MRYNLREAEKAITRTGAFIARSVHYDTLLDLIMKKAREDKVERWRQAGLSLLYACRSAHAEIMRLQEIIDEHEITKRGDARGDRNVEDRPRETSRQFATDARRVSDDP